MTWVSVLALAEPFVLIGCFIGGYFAVKTAVRRSRRVTTERFIDEIHKGRLS